MLRQLHPDLWVADMPFSLMGFELGARTTVVRLANGDLWIHSPIELTPQLRAEIEALGEVKWIVAPNTMHYLHLQEWAKAYPEAKACGVAGLKPIPAVTLARTLHGESEAEWADCLAQTLFNGSVLTTEAVFCHLPSRTLIATDIAFNIPSSRGALTR